MQNERCAEGKHFTFEVSRHILALPHGELIETANEHAVPVKLGLELVAEDFAGLTT